jgi:hypothetical protein
LMTAVKKAFARAVTESALLHKCKVGADMRSCMSPPAFGSFVR